MYTNKIIRLFLASLLLISTGFSSLVISPVQADTSSTVTLSPAIIAKLDAFIVKVQALRSKYSSDENWGMFIDNLSKKILALKPSYVEKPLILAVLDRLNSGVVGLKNTTASASLVGNEDLCKKEGLDNIDENNFDPDKHITRGAAQFPVQDTRSWVMKMNAGQSYSFPVKNNNIPLNLASDSYGYTRSYTNIVNVSERKCDFDKKMDGCFFIWTGNTYSWGMSCTLTPGKKYYINVRWLRKSDIVDAQGKLTTLWKSEIISTYVFGKNSSDLSIAELDKKLNEKFNSQGDSCLGKGVDNFTDCTTDLFFGNLTGITGLPYYNPQKQKEMDAKREAVTAENQRQYQTDLIQRATTETTANPYGLVCPAGQRPIGASCH